MKIVSLAGEMVKEAGTAGLMVSTALPLIAPKLAEIVVAPALTLLANPVPLTAATVGIDDVQPADCVMSRVEPSL